MTGIIDYGVGNLFSLSSSMAAIGAETVITGDKEVLASCDRIILPGVGAFEDAIARLRAPGLDVFLHEQAAEGKPIMGICLGMQLLFEESHEYGCHKGLGLLKGKVVPMAGVIPADYKVPHMGWNALNIVKDHPLLANTPEGEHMYFVHSYYATDCEDSLIATAEYGAPLCAAVGKDNVCGAQFHPEKSGTAGLNMLKAFVEM